MAVMFKLNKIQIALDLQDEKDKLNTFLMGATAQGRPLKQTSNNDESF